jgi:beta-galactosidase
MRILPFLLLACLLQSCSAPTQPADPTAPESGRATLNFNPDWKFLKADPADASAADFNDSAWSIVSAPHTYNDTDTFDSWSLPGHRGEQEQWSGRTWYRKSFTAPSSWQGKKVFIEFEAVRQIAEVYLNGVKLGTAKSGFTPFGFDLTHHLKSGATNVLAIMVDNRFMKDPLDPKIAPQAATSTATQTNLAQLSRQLMEAIPETLEELQADQIPWNNPHWHPAHGGIYRNVRLIVTDPLHITLPLYSFLETEGPYAYATEVTEKSAKVGIEVPVRNDRNTAESVEVEAELIDADGKSVFTVRQRTTLSPGTAAKLRIPPVVVPQPRLWEPAYPHLYRVRISLNARNADIDQVEIPLGIRHIRWTADAGLFLNGEHLKLHGWGQKSTNEWPGLGAAQPDWLQFFTLQLMQEAGGNFVRWGHVPGGPAQIAAGDRLGVIALQPGVDGEHDTVGGAWALRSATFRDLVIYYRNNPSIFIWEGGNQKVSREHAAELRGWMDQYDPHGGRAYAHRRADAITAEFMDVGIGTEGGREIARLPVVEGEYNREESPRRVWDNASPPNFGYPEAKGQTYQLTSEQFAANQVGHYVKKLGAPEHAGGANWIFSDSTSGGRVAVEVARTSGEVDGVRLPKEAYYVTAAMFRDDPQAHIIGHWTYPAGTRKTVYVAANGDAVELFLNGVSLGQGTLTHRYLFAFPEVAFAPGELKAVSTRAGRVIATATKRTVGPPVALKITPIVESGGLQADGSDIALFDVEAVDANGERCPTFQQRVDFELTGPGTWRGGYNSGKINSINHPYLDLEAGINRVAVRAGRTPGTLTLTARAHGLKPASAEVKSVEFLNTLPVMPTVALGTAPSRTIVASEGAATKTSGPAWLGKFIKTLNYTGPNASIVHVEIAARDGRNAYVNVDSPFTALPAELHGADWVQVDNRDALYSAVDLIELAVTGNTIVWIAHDNRLPRPAWLTKQFEPTTASITIAGQKMDLFRRVISADESLTLGANTENTSITAANLYLVFVNTR